MNRPNNKISIPANVRFNSNLSKFDMILFGEINALCAQKGHCWATDSYLAALYNVHISTINKSISRLKKFNLIKANKFIDPQTKKVIKRSIQICQYIDGNNAQIHSKNRQVDIGKNARDNNLTNDIKNKKESLLKTPCLDYDGEILDFRTITHQIYFAFPESLRIDPYDDLKVYNMAKSIKELIDLDYHPFLIQELVKNVFNGDNEFYKSHLTSVQALLNKDKNQIMLISKIIPIYCPKSSLITINTNYPIESEFKKLII